MSEFLLNPYRFAPSGLATAIRFPQSPAGDYLSLIFGAGGSGTFTASWWIKQLQVAMLRSEFACDSSTSPLYDYVSTNPASLNQKRYEIRDGTDIFPGTINGDTSNWWHYVIQFSGTSFQAWKNNTPEASGTRTAALSFNTAILHSIGARARAGSVDRHFPCLMADFILVDGQALTPASFGYDNGGTWSWQEFTGTFSGNTDVRLLFDNAGNLGQATQGPNWTVNGSPVQETSDLPPQ